MLFLDGVYADNKHGTSRFRWVKALTSDELLQLTHTIAYRVGRYLERLGLLKRDTGHTYLTADGVDADNETPMNQLRNELKTPWRNGTTHVILKHWILCTGCTGCTVCCGRMDAQERPSPDWLLWYQNPELISLHFMECSPKAPTFGASNRWQEKHLNTFENIVS